MWVVVVACGGGVCGGADTESIIVRSQSQTGEARRGNQPDRHGGSRKDASDAGVSLRLKASSNRSLEPVRTGRRNERKTKISR